jgi:hypothetical protein
LQGKASEIMKDVELRSDASRYRVARYAGMVRAIVFKTVPKWVVI